MKFILGTVQFGMKYGVTNLDESIDDLEIIDILNFAYDNEINELDTAYSYGTSEEIIGKYIFSNGTDFLINTKLKAIKKNEIHVNEIYELRLSFEKSHQRLKSPINTLFVHDPINLIQTGGHLIYKLLSELKNDGLIKKIGISVYDSLILKKIITNYDIDVVQLPLSIFNQSFYLDGTISDLLNLKIEIQARSIFLQGLLLKDYKRPPYFDRWSRNFNNYFEYLQCLDITPLAACLGFVKNVPGVSASVIGVTRLSELTEIVKYADSVPNCDFSDFSTDDQLLINPGNWNF